MTVSCDRISNSYEIEHGALIETLNGAMIGDSIFTSPVQNVLMSRVS